MSVLAAIPTSDLLKELDRRVPSVDRCRTHNGSTPSPEDPTVCLSKARFPKDGECSFYPSEIRCPECNQPWFDEEDDGTMEPEKLTIPWPTHTAEDDVYLNTAKGVYKLEEGQWKLIGSSRGFLWSYRAGMTILVVLATYALVYGLFVPWSWWTLILSIPTLAGMIALFLQAWTME